MIVTDKTRETPAEWTNALCVELFQHAQDLGHHGNPAGFILTVDLYPFVGYEETPGKPQLKDEAEWDYDGIRSWIASNSEKVQRVWQLEVREDYL